LGAHNPANAAYFDRLRELRDQFGLNAAVHFLAELNEFLPDAVIADLFRLADGLFLPSREEGFGIPVVEAGASGTPIFCTDLPPLRELAGEHALYFDPDAEPESLATRIFHALDSSPVYAMRVRVRKQYTWEKIYAVHIDPLLRSIEGG
jgi:glycosyltransferase involved in cell wall biosynthesis